jgi:hypothetical protein
VAADHVLHGGPFTHPKLQETHTELAFQDRIEAAYYATLTAWGPSRIELPVLGTPKRHHTHGLVGGSTAG